MPDIINSSFDPRLPFPLDVRQQKNDLNALYAIPNTSRWEGMVVYVKGAGIPYILKGGIDNSFWTPFQFNGGGGILPNGIVVYGESQQSGNDILLNDAWVWRIDQVDYQSSDDVISITPAAAGKVRIDNILGNALGDFVKEVGVEVDSPGPAIEPNIPPNTVPLLRVEVNDTGITAITEFALSAFVRFDIDNQGLTPTYRQNARTNIQAVSKDTNDSRTGGLTNNGKVTIDLDEASSSLPILELFQQGVLKHLFSGEQARILPKLLRVNSPVSPTDEGASFRGGTNGGDPIFEIQNAAGTKIFYPRGTGGIGQLRSTLSDESIRRDENYLTYPVTISGTGKLNDVALANGVGAIKFSSGVTEVSGIDPNGDTKELFIWSDNPDGITLPAQDTDSIAANRYLREVNVPYQTWVKTVYDTDLSRWVNGNTGELQETDARYFEVTDDVLTLKYILPDTAALQAFVRGPSVIAEVSDPLRGGRFNYVAEGDFSGSADFGISFPAQDGGYWVRMYSGDVIATWYDLDISGSTNSSSVITTIINQESRVFFPKGIYLFGSELSFTTKTVDFYGEEGTIFKHTDSFSNPMLSFDDCDNLKIQNIIFEGPETFATFDQMPNTRSCVFVENSDKISIKNIQHSGKSYGVALNTVTDSEIENINGLGFMLGEAEDQADSQGSNYHSCLQIQACNSINVSKIWGRNIGSCTVVGLNSEKINITDIFPYNCFDNGVYVSSGYDCIVTNVLSEKIQGMGVKVRGSRNKIISCYTKTSKNGFSITGNGATPDSFGANGFSNIITGCVAEDCKIYGITATDQDGLYQRNIKITNNWVINPSTDNSSASGIHVCGDYMEINNNTIINAQGAYAIQPFGQSGSYKKFFEIRNNVIINSTGEGIRTIYIEDSLIEGNRIYNPTGVGINVRFTDRTIFRNNYGFSMSANLITLTSTYSSNDNIVLDNIGGNVAVTTADGNINANGYIATTSVYGRVKKAAASANTASPVGATYNQAEVQAILTELRDMKDKFQDAEILNT